ncbi:MAG: phage tail tube protein [Bacillota bacterium]
MIDGRNTINGTYGSVFFEGEFLSNVQNFSAQIDFNKEEIFLAGRKFASHKTMGATGTGSMSGFRVNSRFMELILEGAKDAGRPFYTELIGKLEDPEMGGKVYRVRLSKVSFNSIPLLNYEVNSVLNEELEFTFENAEILDTF